MPSVSVILPTRDRTALLREALESLRGQEEVPGGLEVVVVDGNRAEPRLRRQPGLAPLLAALRAVVVEAPEAPNAAAARNRGLAAARGDWIAYLDDDDVCEPARLRRQLELALRTGAPLVLCGCVVELPGRRRLRQVDREAYAGDAVLLDATFGTQLVMHRRDDRFRFPEELDAGEDLVMAHRILAGAGVRSVPCVRLPLVRVRPQAGSRVNTNAAGVVAARERVAAERAADFSPRALAVWALRTRLLRFKLGGAGWAEGAAAAAALVRAGGRTEARFAVNALAGRLPGLRRLVVT